jgi:hypothetical protein
MERLEHLREYRNENETLVTLVANHITNKVFLEKLEQTHESCRKIGNSIKKHALCTAIFSFFKKVSERDENEMNHAIYFLYFNEQDGKTIHISEEYPLSNQEKEVLREYQFRDYIYRTDVCFPLDEWKDIFTNFDFLQVVHVNQQQWKHQKMNQYKQKEICSGKISNESQLVEIVERVGREHCKRNEKVYIYGQSNYFGKIREMKNIYFRMEHFTREEVWKWKQDEQMKDYLQLLQERLQEMQDEKKVDLFVFGRIKMEIKEHIENYQFKELFIEERKLPILKSMVSHDLLNFSIIPIRSLESGDIGERFIREYHGLMGIKYF